LSAKQTAACDGNWLSLIGRFWLLPCGFLDQDEIEVPFHCQLGTNVPNWARPFYYDSDVAGNGG
jgi:hypothetical protein